MSFSSSSLLVLILFLLFQSQQLFSSLLLPLTHTLSSIPSTSQFSLLQTSLNKIRQRQLQRQGRQISLPLASGADYTLTLSISSASVSLYLDTGSDLSWFPCSPFECILCENKGVYSHPLPPPSNSHPLPCSSPLCSSAHSSLPLPDLCGISLCRLDDIETSSCSQPCPTLYYSYADGSLLASLRIGRLSFLPNFTFACSHTALAEPLGVAGFGPGPLSIPSQLKSISPSLASRFSYCLIHHSFLPHRIPRPSPLILGRSSSIPFAYTPILTTHPQLFYSISLLSISVATVPIHATSRLVSDGIAVDSGTTFTMLPRQMHRKLKAEFGRQMEGRGFVRAEWVEERMGLGPCFRYGRNETWRVPRMGLNFAGNATVWMPARNYFLGFESEGEDVGCLMVVGGGDDGEGPVGTLGNFQQQGIEVVYDLEVGRIGFARRRCDRLWDSVSHG